MTMLERHHPRDKLNSEGDHQPHQENGIAELSRL
jgi:hypothetical protein